VSSALSPGAILTRTVAVWTGAAGSEGGVVEESVGVGSSVWLADASGSVVGVGSLGEGSTLGEGSAAGLGSSLGAVLGSGLGDSVVWVDGSVGPVPSKDAPPRNSELKIANGRRVAMTRLSALCQPLPEPTVIDPSLLARRPGDW
jgi:hypothetical protein